MINSHNRIATLENVVSAGMDNLNANLRVALPCFINSYDPDTLTCSAQPTIKGVIQKPDGGTETVDYPLLVDVPVVFPQGGGAILTFPIKPGDECLVVFADRCIDFWWQNGGIQDAVDPRKHHLADGIAFVGIRSQARMLSDISTEAVQLRSDDGSAFIELNPSSKNIQVKTSANVDVKASSANVEANNITLTGTVTINGMLQLNGPIIQGSNTGKPQTATFNGSINATGDIQASGISLQQHKHPYDKGDTGAPK